ncbi:cytochrome P450 [Dactylonectria estremocensis]|uniref:Cytochrome P450 n=1 Tax=Dactylonectria estremocensis TaxID=1079267 RepID=A0A9P9DG95_9HYPO|nr:cytochrome P450 [Dactylonectria estremocensis]
MLLIIVPYLLLLAVVGLLIYPAVSYLLDQKGLRSFPSPSVAAFTPLWRIWHNVNWNHYAAVHQAHERYGAHVRIAPNHVSILDARAPYEIYGHGANMLKEGWYDAGAGAHRNLSDTRDKAEHQAKRKMLAHAFAAKTVTELEPVLQETIHAMLTQLDGHIAAGTKPNMRRLLNYFTIDLFGQLLFSTNLGCLDRGDDLLVAESKDGRLYRAPFIDSLLDVTVVNTVLGMMPSLLPVSRPLFTHHPYKKSGIDWENILHHNIKQRMAQDMPMDDLFQKLLQDSKGQDLNLHVGQIASECATLMNAGTETTAAALTSTLYLLYTHPECLKKLRHEVDDAFPGTQVPTYETASKLPFLRACIEESLRVRPASSMGLPRIVPDGGRVIAGKFVAGGVTVSVPTYSLLRDENAFSNASQYNPDRWMTEDRDERERMMKSHLPFSTGPRACIGRNIAYFEQLVIIATLVKFFDGQVEEGFELVTEERFNSNQGDLSMGISRRR